MHDDDAVIHDAIALELSTAAEETARLHRELDAIQSNLTRVVELFLQYTGRTDLPLDFLASLGNRRRTLH
jgi:hypothetical protein